MRLHQPTGDCFNGLLVQRCAARTVNRAAFCATLLVYDIICAIWNRFVTPLGPRLQAAPLAVVTAEPS
jgi:hypothetical protein